MNGTRVTLCTDAELERPPGDAKRAVGVSHAKSWRRNIYASKLAHCTFFAVLFIPNYLKAFDFIILGGGDAGFIKGNIELFLHRVYTLQVRQ